MSLNLRNKVAIVIGATGSIGREIVMSFLEQGCRVSLGDTSIDRLNLMAEELVAAHAIILDEQNATDVKAPARIVMRTRARFGRLDFVVTAAGLLKRNSILDISDDEFALIRTINFDYVFRICRAAIPHMEDGGAIVNLASLSAHTGRGHSADYAASKGAVVALTKSIAEEIAPRLRANCVSPGFVETPLSKPIIDDNGANLVARIPLGRFGTSQEIAQTVMFLCSDWASYITGQTIHVNGGLYSPG